MLINREKFYDGVRKAYGKLNQNQVNGLEYLLDGIEAQVSNIGHAAYMLATVKHETAHTYLPIKEYRNRPGTKGRANQDRYWITGYYGRGYVQLTWERNYDKVGKGIGVDLKNNPDLALDPAIAFKVMVYGMNNGTFTGKKLTDYISGSKKDYVNARRIINGTDKASLIAGYATQFEKILTGSKVQADTAPKPTPAITSMTLDEPLGSPNSPPETLVGITEAKLTEEAGDKTLELTSGNELDVTIKAKVPEPLPYNGIGFWATIKRDLAVATGGNLSFAGISEYAQQAHGWPEWLVGIIGKLALGLLIVTIGYFIFRVVHYGFDSWKQSQRAKLLAEINSDPKRRDMEFI